MPDKKIYTLLRYGMATVWIANGLFCKVLHLVPRHEQIVARIIGADYAAPLTRLIGVAEMLMALWIVSGIKTRWNAVVQIAVVAVMNILEFMLVPDLLLWGRSNALFALLFILVVYWNEFVQHPQPVRQI